MKLCLALLVFMAACSSAPKFKPEVGGEGAISSKGDVVYSIPPEHSVLKMKLVAVGITKENRLSVRMFFLREGGPAGEYLDPREQTLWLPDAKTGIVPAKVYASAEAKPLVRLANQPKQAIELLFPLPAGGHNYPFVNLKWKIHYGQNEIMAENERFDLMTKTPMQQGVGQYYGGYEGGALEFPYAYGPMLPEDWAMRGGMWW